MRILFILIFCLFALTGCSKGDILSPPITQSKNIELPVIAENLITDAEVSSTDANHRYYDRNYQTVTFAGEGSGPTWAIGVDGGFNSSEFTTTSWSPYFSSDIVKRLARCSGDTSVSAAKLDIKNLQDIIFNWNIAIDEFNNFEVPNYYQLSLRTFPGLNLLSRNAQGAIVSLVFNRGSSMVGSSRVDMRTLRDAVKSQDYQAMAKSIKHMNTTMANSWKSAGIYEGMVNRRNAEAELILTPD